MKHSHSRFVALAVAFVAAVVLALPVTALAADPDPSGKPPTPAPQVAWYNGESHHFRSVVKDANGTELTEGTDFERDFCFIRDRSNPNDNSVWCSTDENMKDSGNVFERIKFKGAFDKWGNYYIRHNILTLYDFFAPNVTKVEGEEDPTLQGTLQLTLGNPETEFSASDFKLTREPGEEPGEYNIIVNTDQEKIPDQGSNKAGTRTGLGTIDLGGYTTKYLVGDDICGFNYIRLVPGKLTITPAYTQVNVTVAWKDSSNKDGIRPSAEDFAKYLTLTADGEPTDAQAVIVENGDTYNVVFDNVRKYAYDENGVRHEIAYQVTQANIDGYTTDNATVGNKGTITNTHEIAAAPAEKPSTEKPAAKKTSRKDLPQTGDQSANALAIVALGATALGAAVVMKKRNEL
ncbi:MAG: Cna B-type domain-containing protein [Ellagibacter isourolithinifaciens]|uniref:Cna B-type domain-containing protein n=1 Tax=Ellagibacter isourolithinifaciens TaxID=2137581 RepID=UPI0023F1B243|nr:Cna B-type domain-containing protein [Ellagibacter isourolithinifaciens]MDD7689769.1 Cna B-type domain-containing protein [Ellagibacter isourolithinifaciens]MDY4647547.1 Cna B-type domain-containing protein [Collinsella sp.]